MWQPVCLLVGCGDVDIQPSPRLLAAAPAEMNNLRQEYADWTALSPNKVASRRAGRAAAAEHNCICKREAHVWVLLTAHERAHAAPQLRMYT